MNVKVKLRSEREDVEGKVEYFNDVDWWNVSDDYLEIFKYTKADHSEYKKIATIRYWHWIKED